MNRPLVVVALLGGIANRFWPLKTDKGLFPFMGRPFAEYTVNEVLPADAEKLLIVTNPQNDANLKNMKFRLPHTTVIQNQAQGMAAALLTCQQYIKDKRLLLLIGDHLVSRSLVTDILKEAEKKSAYAILPGLKVDRYYPYAYYALSGQRILKMLEKPGPGHEPSQYVNISGHYFQDANSLIERLKAIKSDGDDRYEQTLSSLMEDHEFLMHEYQGFSSSLKYPWDVLTVSRDILNHFGQTLGSGQPVVKKNVIIEGDVYIGNNVKIYENTKITGPVFIGDNSIIGNNNIIRESHIGANCVTGFNTDITRSYIGDDCWFHSNYIGDSVLENNVSLGSGAVLANLKLDEQNIKSSVGDRIIDAATNKLGAIIGQDVRIGVNASVMPGKKIGSNSMISAGCVITRDVPSDSFCQSQTVVNTVKITKQVNRPAIRNNFKKKLQ